GGGRERAARSRAQGGRCGVRCGGRPGAPGARRPQPGQPLRRGAPPAARLLGGRSPGRSLLSRRAGATRQSSRQSPAGDWRGSRSGAGRGARAPRLPPQRAELLRSAARAAPPRRDARRTGNDHRLVGGGRGGAGARHRRRLRLRPPRGVRRGVATHPAARLSGEHGRRAGRHRSLAPGGDGPARQSRFRSGGGDGGRVAPPDAGAAAGGGPRPGGRSRFPGDGRAGALLRRGDDPAGWGGAPGPGDRRDVDRRHLPPTRPAPHADDRGAPGARRQRRSDDRPASRRRGDSRDPRTPYPHLPGAMGDVPAGLAGV
ncbi:MAG: hypothetical protein AVDCRST_MAG18-1375, partial [uncultured Thermomicrobiales bacterium]